MISIIKMQEILKNAFREETFLFQPAELYDPIRYTLSLGGKRIRPLLVLLGCDLFGGDIDKALAPAIGMEIFHNFTLLHDDIMDQASIRRGKDTVHKKWNSNIAILSGDTMLVLAYEYITKSEKEILPELFAVFNLTGRQVCEGQQFDMNFESREKVTLEEYIEMIRLKTAVLLGCSLKTGAIIARAPLSETEKMYRFGENLGMAFQLQDDLLDCFGDEGKFGKEIGGDILCNKKTFLYIKAFELAGPAETNALKFYFSNRQHDPSEKIREVKNIYKKLEVKEYTDALITSFFEKGLKFLNEVKVGEPAKSELYSFSKQLLNRES
jgi:geranylgeranyl diphosphate synthase type II